MKKIAILITFIIALCFLIPGFIQRQLLSYKEDIFILEDIYKQGITNNIGKTVFIKTRLFGFDGGRKQPFIRLENAEKYIDVSNLKLSDEAKKYTQKDISRAQINLVSSDFKVIDVVPHVLQRYIPIYYNIFFSRINYI